jgi:hypothetical protein
VCERDRERERERERARVRERERERARVRERQSVCAFMYTQSDKGHASERNETHENTGCSARTRKCYRPTRRAAAACECLPRERCTTGWCVCVCVCVCLCVSVRERETEREKERESERE